MIKVIIPASGVGARFGADIPKQFTELKGEPILKRTIFAFQCLDIVDEIVVAVPQGYADTVANYGFTKVRHVVEGGQNRAYSVYAAVKMLPADTEIVLIHDGVRPFVTGELVQAVADAVKQHGAAIACAPVTDTIKQTSLQNNITATLDRSQLWRAQTPQGFTYSLITQAYLQAEKDGILERVTDDSALVERLGIPVYVVTSSPANIKITTPEDLVIAEAMLAACLPPDIKGRDDNFSKKVTIYTDGACSGNPGPGGYGTVLIHGEHRKELSGGEAQTTNNRMEMMAVIIGLETLKQPCEVDLYSDSRYVVDAIEKGWVTRWKQNNWMRNKKEAALNVDLWERLLPLLATHQVTFHWVKGHAGHPENERCDELARRAIEHV